MTFIIGATGNVGSEVIKRLQLKGRVVKGLTRKPPTSSNHWILGDLEKPASYATELEGEEELILITPAHPDMVMHQVGALKAAKTAGVKHVVKLSGLGAGPDAPIRLPKLHYEIEQEIIASGIDYTFIRPNLFSQVLLGAAETINKNGRNLCAGGRWCN
ncbi:NAD(P)H azoreductase [mine drainage metagenome]|uniref:NAD(P)H azoreductase n=1 Tax=mine drainage metagenome TaxID=410659 RepID=A0A1J5R962_9ZZZZ